METVTEKSRIAEAIRKQDDPEKMRVFRPSSEFYKAINIRRKRWGQLYRGEKEPLRNEMERIASFFGIDITELLNK